MDPTRSSGFTSSEHCDQQASLQCLSEVFTWKTMQQDMKELVQNWLYCLTVDGCTIPRSFGEQWYATEPNEVLYMDYLSMPDSQNYNYILVLNDDFRGHVELVPSSSATAEVVATALSYWLMRFGVVKQRVSDQGTHFKNQAMPALQKTYRTNHHFTTTYCPWFNSTVEVVTRSLLHYLKALLSKLKLMKRQWVSVLTMVQSSLNHMPASWLEMIAPFTALTQFPATSTVLNFAHSQSILFIKMEDVWDLQRAEMKEVQEDLEKMHKKYVETASARRE